MIPTACEYSPMLVNRSISAVRIMQAIAINTGVGIGTPGMKLPKYLKVGSLITGSSLLLIHAAIDRPAVNRISVATMG